MKREICSAFLIVLSSLPIGIGQTRVNCNFENLLLSNLCDGWEVEDATNVVFAVTDHHSALGIPGPSPTGDDFLYVHQSGVSQDGALFLLFSTNKPFSTKVKLTFDYFLTSKTRWSSTKIQVLHYESNVLIAFVTESTEGHWRQYSSNEVTVKSLSSTIELGIVITVDRGDVIAIDNFELTDAVWPRQLTITETADLTPEKETELIDIQRHTSSTKESIDFLKRKIYAFIPEDRDKLLTTDTIKTITESNYRMDEDTTESLTEDPTTTSEKTTESVISATEAAVILTTEPATEPETGPEISSITKPTSESTSESATETPSDIVTVSSSSHPLWPYSVTVKLRNCLCQCTEATFDKTR